MPDVGPYTNWFYFPTREAAEAAAAELATEDYHTGVRLSVNADDPDEPNPWLMLAAKPRNWDLKADAYARPLERLAARHGGVWDGGETGWLNLRTGKYFEGSGS